MSRVAIIGNGGGGKTTLSVKLGKALGIKVHHIDKIQFGPGWKTTAIEELTRQHDEILAMDRWIIDGWGGWSLIEQRFALADTIVLIDMPIYLHYWWALKRQIAFPFRSTPDRPKDCPLLPKTWEMMKVLWFVHRRLRPRLIEVIESHRESKLIIQIRSRRELHEFGRSYCEAA